MIPETTELQAKKALVQNNDNTEDAVAALISKLQGKVT